MTHSGSLHIREELITSIFSPFSSPAEFCPEDYFCNFGEIIKILGLIDIEVSSASSYLCI